MHALVSCETRDASFLFGLGSLQRGLDKPASQLMRGVPA